ncbi:MAG: nucleotide pyrophosphatase/phosphodiesterase family protein [Planctomycetota bacterium]
MSRVCVINVVGLTPKLTTLGPCLSELGEPVAWKSPVPAVTCTSQATMLTGTAPREHGIVGNGWYYRDTQEVRFWQQANSLVQGDKLYDRYETAKMFWWFNQSSGVRYSATPKPHYGSDGSKVFDILDYTDCRLVEQLGPFPFFNFWGPSAGLPSSKWIADATAIVMRKKQPQLTMVYLPHLDYDYQRLQHHDPQRVVEVDQCVQTIVAAAEAIDAKVVVVSEYGLTTVDQPVYLNRILRANGFLAERQGIRTGPFGEMLVPGDAKAFAVCDHQIAHIYVQQPNDISAVRQLLEKQPGVEAVVDPGELELDHERSGELVAIADANAWFSYYYWNDDIHAPDFARCVDIHRKPGYDPCELFITSKLRAATNVAKKKLGFRYRMDVIPLDATLVGGSHGRLVEGEDGPVIIGPEDPPQDMKEFRAYIDRLLQSN